MNISRAANKLNNKIRGEIHPRVNELDIQRENLETHVKQGTVQWTDINGELQQAVAEALAPKKKPKRQIGLNCSFLPINQNTSERCFGRNGFLIMKVNLGGE